VKLEPPIVRAARIGRLEGVGKVERKIFAASIDQSMRIRDLPSIPE
jgi:hypothetical protein